MPDSDGVRAVFRKPSKTLSLAILSSRSTISWIERHAKATQESWMRSARVVIVIVAAVSSSSSCRVVIADASRGPWKTHKTFGGDPRRAPDQEVRVLLAVKALTLLQRRFCRQKHRHRNADFKIYLVNMNTGRKPKERQKAKNQQKPLDPAPTYQSKHGVR